MDLRPLTSAITKRGLFIKYEGRRTHQGRTQRSANTFSNRRIIGATAHRHQQIYGQFTCDKPARSLEWTRAQVAVCSSLGLDGGMNPPPYAQGPRRGPPFFSAERFYHGQRQRNDSATCRDDGWMLALGRVLLRRGKITIATGLLSRSEKIGW